MRIQMQRHRGVRIVAVVAVTSVIAAAGAWTMPAPAAQRSTLRSVTGTVSCSTAWNSLQITAYAYRPDPFGYALASVYTGPPNTPGTISLLAVETDKSNYTLDHRCSRSKTSVGLTHRGLRSAGVVKSGYYQSLTAYCGAPNRVIVRYRIGFDSSDKPATATISVWAKRKHSSRLRETGYVQWSRSRSITYYSPKSCVGQY
jgi:hypothetical protein